MNKLGNKNIVKKMFGNKEVLKEVLNGSVIYSAEEELPAYVMFSSPESIMIVANNPSSAHDGTIEYSRDGIEWTTWNHSPVGGTKVYFRGIGNTYCRGSFAGSLTSFFNITGSNVSVSGNLNALLDYQTENLNLSDLSSNTFEYLFGNLTNLIDAKKLILPATTLSSGCYNRMFAYCSNLITLPKLQATTLASNCYVSMFEGCTSLTQLPKLPVLNVSYGAYGNMFLNCTNIKLSETQTGEYQKPYRIPTTGEGTVSTMSLMSMFYNTGGTFTGTPEINTNYYTSNTIV